MLKCIHCEKQLKGKQKDFCSSECYHAHKEVQNYIWTSYTYGKVTEDEMFDIIKLRVGDDIDEWIIVPGVDSQSHKNKSVIIETITCYKNTKGGFYFRRSHKRDLFHDLRTKIYYETQTILDLTKSVVNLMLEKDILCEFVLHLDLGEDAKKSKTAALVPEIKGWVESMGYTVLFKPHSYGASSIADKHSK